MADRAYRMGVEAIHKLGQIAKGRGDFSREPSLLLAKSMRDIPFLRLELQARRDAGLSVEFLDRTSLREQFGIVRAGAILSDVGASVDPYRLTHALFQRWAGQGLRVFDRTDVTNYRLRRNRVVAHTDRKHSVTCRRVFFATGFEVKQLLKGPYVKLRSTYALVSEPLRDLGWWKKRCLIWETGDPYLYARQTNDGRVMAGGEDDFVLNGTRRDRRTMAKSLKIQRKFERLFPGSSIERAFWWSGTFGSTDDGLPFIGSHPDFPHGYFALGFGGNGITFSVMAAEILRDKFLGRANRDAALYGFDRRA